MLAVQLAKSFNLRSIRNRTTFLTLIIFVISSWSIAFYANQKLSQDLRQVFSDQQFSVASILATEVNEDLQDRAHVLERTAQELGSLKNKNVKVMKAMLENNRSLEVLFNGGFFITSVKGIAIASGSSMLNRVGVDFLDRDYIKQAIKGGKTVIGKPVMGKILNSPILSIATPIRDKYGKVEGVLIGVTDLGKPNFLDHMTDTFDRNGGSVLLISPEYNMYITASDKSYVMQPIPVPGKNKMLDRYMKGYNGAGIAVSSKGVEELSAGHNIFLPNWIVITRLPTSIAFSPLYKLQNSLIYSLLFLIFLIGFIIWWMLKDQLEPLVNASETLASFEAGEVLFKELPIVRNDEVGTLISGFNHLLKKLGHREEQLTSVLRVLRFRSSINGLLREAGSEQELVQGACDIAVDSIGYVMAWVGFAENDVNKSVRPICFAGHEAGYLEQINISWGDNIFGLGPTGAAIREHRPVFCPDLLNSPVQASWKHLGIERGYRSSIALPLIVDDVVIGALSLYRTVPNIFTDEEVRLLSEVAKDLSYGIAALRMKEYKILAAENLERKDLLLTTRTKLLDCASTYPFESFLRHALDEISAAIKSPIAFFHKVDADQNSLTLQDWSTRTLMEFCKAEGKGMHYSIDHAGVWADSVRTGAPVMHNDYPNLANKKGLPPGHAHIARELVVPINRSGKTAGILGVGNKAIDYDKNDLEMLTYLADVLLELFETKQAAAELEKSRELNETLMQTIPFPMDIVDENGTILFASNKMQEVLGRELKGERCWNVYKDNNQQCSDCPLATKINLSATNSLETTGVLGGRTFEIFHTAIHYAGKNAILEIFQDITDRKQMDAKLIQSDRLASMGMLAAGIAHEINNPLAYTMLNLESIGDILQNAPSASMLTEASQLTIDAMGGIERVSKIVKGLRTLSQVENVEIEFVNINRPLEIALEMANNEIKYKAKILQELGESLIVRANEGQLAQIFLNLLINAAHSIPTGDVEHNTILLRTWKEGNEICASVTDTGSGIEEKLIGKIFEPFFTTKPSGIGSGLGLAISQNIAQSFGGHLEVQSVVGKGTIILLRLKEQSSIDLNNIDKIAMVQPLEEINVIKGRFLIIDDEVEIRKSISRVLVGCTIVEAESGEIAKNILKNDRAFDYILCDMMMSNISGIDLYEWLMQESPLLAGKIIFTTGGAFTARAQAIFKNIGNRKIEKPFTVEMLRRALNQLIKSP